MGEKGHWEEIHKWRKPRSWQPCGARALPGLRLPSGLSPARPPALLGPQPLCVLELGPVPSQETFSAWPSFLPAHSCVWAFPLQPPLPSGQLVLKPVHLLWIVLI